MSRARLIASAAALAAVLGAAGCSKEDPGPAEPGQKRKPTTQPVKAKVTIPEKLSEPKVASEAIDAAHAAKAQRLVNDGLMYMIHNRDRDHAWSMGGGVNKPAVTAMALKALLQHPDFDADSPLVKNGFDVLLSYRQGDGGIYSPQAGYANYTTSLSVMALSAARSSRYRNAVEEAVKYLRGIQITPGEDDPKGGKVAEDDPRVGGAGYGSHVDNSDGSNAGMWMQAMHDAGVPTDDPAMKRALTFFTRMQNWKETNKQAWAMEGPNDGGFIYDTRGESKAGTAAGGKGRRSYGSLTYVGFKSLLYAGLTKDDSRVKAARQWIGRHWTLDRNPNMPEKLSLDGLYYYYHAFAKALRAWGEAEIVDAKGEKHNWRHELIDELAERVREDGSWVNENSSRWNEGNPMLATAYSVLALQEALRK